ncbi:MULTISPECIES: arsenate reductase/protein-tyrosine-phosphatase family protein [unclassified Pseudoclavibacter]|uniref:arsenate reductase/protein-tyrosine-phosphatase family protein n=1 Tax=unclassified Pseudoclavibacter TaxID=2615177 RepID=UPI0012F1C3E7|nr:MULTISPECIES: hypothetical protein [unclassified Pseudoclavibacter]MBF4457391.1 hypothetical protein [Pseudoclavibacter sp. VKM Ac-2867]VXC42969.1 conserved hypothetical protein [Pseudoclavibacter sp. 8L]
MPSLLFVCHANIARSAAAEFLARAQLGPESDWQVSSAGVRALVGEDIDPTISAAVRDRGVEPTPHVARQVDVSMLKDADLVLAFEGAHRSWMLSESPKAVRNTFTIRSAARLLETIPRRAAPLPFLAHVKTPPGGDLDFADPYGRGPAVAKQAVAEIDALLATILPGIDAIARTPRLQTT